MNGLETMDILELVFIQLLEKERVAISNAHIVPPGNWTSPTVSNMF
jgi:hypothetical protein